MRRMRTIGLLLFLTVWMLGLAGPVLAQDPVSLDEVSSYVVVLEDGRLDVRYTIRFTERESGGRDRFNAVGRFTTPLEILEAGGEGPDGSFPVNVTETDRPG